MIDLSKVTKVMTVSAHPDDAALFFGGTIARLVDEGKEVTEVTVDDGRGSPHSFEMSAEELMTTRHKELTWETNRLGSKMVHLQLHGVKTPENRAKCVAEICKVIDKVRPQLVITQCPEDAHQTHSFTSRLCLSALIKFNKEHSDWPLPVVWLSDGWETVHYPTVRFDVTQYMNIKVAAVAMHGSQVFDTPYVMGSWGLSLYRAGFAASHDVTDPKMVFAEAFREAAPEQIAEELAKTGDAVADPSFPEDQTK